MICATPVFGFHINGPVNPDPEKDFRHEVNSECQRLQMSNIQIAEVGCGVGLFALVDITNTPVERGDQFCVISVFHEHSDGDFHAWIIEGFADTGICDPTKPYIGVGSMKAVSILTDQGIAVRANEMFPFGPPESSEQHQQDGSLPLKPERSL